jgi:hypothetical protein
VSNCFSNVNNLQILLLRSFLLTWWGLILSIG